MGIDWKLTSGRIKGNHPTIMESTTGVVACGHSWCTGGCGLPALVLNSDGRELRVYGAMVACGPVFQSWRVKWTGKKVPVTLGGLSEKLALGRIWM